MSDIDLSEAVEAAARGWYDGERPPGTASFDEVAAVARHRVAETLLPAITAALPHIERQVRERVAREIEAEAAKARSQEWMQPAYGHGRVYALADAARIARGGAS